MVYVPRKYLHAAGHACRSQAYSSLIAETVAAGKKSESF
jgi:hypothetical protein